MSLPMENKVYVTCLGGCGRSIRIGQAYCEVCVHNVFRETEAGTRYIGEKWEGFVPLNSPKTHRN